MKTLQSGIYLRMPQNGILEVSVSSDADSLDYEDDEGRESPVNGMMDNLSESNQSLTEESAEADDIVDSPVQRKTPSKVQCGMDCVSAACTVT